MSEHIRLKADYSDFEKLIEWIKPLLWKEKLDGKEFSRMMITVEEMFTNIAKYAYPNSHGSVDVKYSSDEKKLSITFIDSGIAFDPTKVAKPDITIPIDERIPGGLGIFISKLFLDEMNYERDVDKNILTIVKYKS